MGAGWEEFDIGPQFVDATRSSSVPELKSLDQARDAAIQEVRAVRKLADQARAGEQSFLQQSKGRSALWARLVRFTARRNACIARRAALPDAAPSVPDLDRAIETLTREVDAMADVLGRGPNVKGHEAEVAAALRTSRNLAQGLTSSELLPSEVQRLDHLLAELDKSPLDRGQTGALRGWIEDQAEDLREVVNALGWADLDRVDRCLARVDERLERMQDS